MYLQKKETPIGTLLTSCAALLGVWTVTNSCPPSIDQYRVCHHPVAQLAQRLVINYRLAMLHAMNMLRAKNMGYTPSSHWLAYVSGT